jgi:hypothetical protein
MVLPTAVVAAVVRPSMPIPELTARVRDLLGQLQADGANLDVADADAAVDQGLELLAERDVVAVERRVVRVRQRSVLRFYARQLAHLRPHASDADAGDAEAP